MNSSYSSPYKSVVPQGEWKVRLFRRWPFGKLMVRWYFEAEVPKVDEAITLEFPPIVLHDGQRIWLANSSSPTVLKCESKSEVEGDVPVTLINGMRHEEER